MSRRQAVFAALAFSWLNPHAWLDTAVLIGSASLAYGAGADAWEELGRCYAEQGDTERTAKALANALAVQHGEAPASLMARHSAEDLLAPLPVAEERDDMGIPRLPGAPRKPA